MGYARPGGGPNTSCEGGMFGLGAGADNISVSAGASTGDANLADMIAGSLKEELAANFNDVCRSELE